LRHALVRPFWPERRGRCCIVRDAESVVGTKVPRAGPCLPHGGLPASAIPQTNRQPIAALFRPCALGSALTPFGFPKGTVIGGKTHPQYPPQTGIQSAHKGMLLLRHNCRKSRVHCANKPGRFSRLKPERPTGQGRADTPSERVFGGAGTDYLRSSLFGSLKRDDRENWRNPLVLFAFSTPSRREMPRNSMKTGFLAADLGRLDSLNRAPECWKCFGMLRPRVLPPCPSGRIA